MSQVMKDVIKVVNFIRSKGLKHREFQTFLIEVKSEYGNVLYFSKVHWLEDVLVHLRGECIHSYISPSQGGSQLKT